MKITIEMTKDEKEITNPDLGNLIAEVVAQNTSSPEIMRIDVKYTKE